MPPAACRTVAKDSRVGDTSWELADIFRAYGPGYARNHALPPSHHKVIRAVVACRTEALGGHIERCDACGFERPTYNSCRNRHCPKCQMMAKAAWLQAREAELLPVGYFHNVFTLPHELNALALCNKRVVFDILFESAAKTLQQFAADPKHGLGGRIGLTALLHTWDQQLRHHIHLHCLIPGGALSFDGSRWILARQGFLFPVRALSKVFRGKFIESLKKAFSKGQLLFPGETAIFASEQGFARLIEHLWKKEWVVYCKKPFGGAQSALDYLGRYTHRVAIANHRIASVKDGMVSFWYRDRGHGRKLTLMGLAAEEFIRRFLLHVLPKSYVRIRHFGLLANRCKKRDLSRCQELLGQKPTSSEPAEMSAREMLLHLTGLDLDKCPNCGRGTMHVVADLPPTRLPLGFSSENLSPVGIDSS